MKSLSLLILAGTLVSIAQGCQQTADQIPPVTATNLTRTNVVQIIEGVLFGILKETVPTGSLDACIDDAYIVESNMMAAVRDFESLTFDGIKQGLNEAGVAVKAIPTALKECGGAI